MGNRLFSTRFRAGALAVLAAALAACTPERTRVVEEPGAPPDETPRNYREALERVRTRQAQMENLQAIEEAIRRFQSDVARMPTNLYELVQRKYLPTAQDPPEGFVYSYDPVHGNVSLVPVTPEGLFRPPVTTGDESRISAEPPPNLPPPPL